MCTCFCFIRLIEMTLVCLWESVSCAEFFGVCFIRLIEILLVCLWENVSFASVLRGSYAQLKRYLCVCGRMYHVHMFLRWFYMVT